MLDSSETAQMEAVEQPLMSRVRTSSRSRCCREEKTVLHSIVTSFHEDMHSTDCFNGATSDAFPVSSGVE